MRAAVRTRALSLVAALACAAGLLTGLAGPGAQAATPCTSAPFRDVAAGSQFCTAVTWLKGQKITGGYSDGGFHPASAISRQAMAAFLYRLQNPGKTAPACTSDPFTDVATSSQFCGAIAWLSGQKITGGYSDGGFHPAAAISRQAMAAFLYRLQNPGRSAPACTSAAFRDVAATNSFCGDVAWLKKQSIAGGYSDGGFHPTAAISRQAMAAFLYRLRHPGSSSGTAQVRVVTYNILSSTFDGTAEGDGTVAAWSKRLPGVLALLKSAHADLITLQEASGIVVPYSTGHPSVRQVDQVASGLAGSGFTLDDTSAGTDSAGRYTGDYILYRGAALTPVGTGGHWSIGDGRYASYQVFRPAGASGEFLFVGTHLMPGTTSANNTQRGRETTTLTGLARKVAGGVPIVYAGDFNTYPKHAGFVDTPGKAMTAAGAKDSWSIATHRYNASYSSLNQYFRTPKQGTGNSDHIFVTPGVGASATGVELQLTKGRFVGPIPSDHNPLWATLHIPD